jgi:hypothetical protein
MATIFKPLTGLPYYIPNCTEVPASELKRARLKFETGGVTYKLASHKADPTDHLYIWMVGSDGTAMSVDDDANHLADAEFEGVFSMRCINGFI